MGMDASSTQRNTERSAAPTHDNELVHGRSVVQYSGMSSMSCAA